MTENRAIEILKKMKHMFTETCAKIDENTALDMAVEAIKEIQQYRAIGTIEELQALKDAEEQGLLLRLPCKVGDTIYAIPSRVNHRLNKNFGHAELNRVIPQIVDHIEFNSYGHLVSTNEGMTVHRLEEFGETWFLTREEAEQALAKMQGT